MVTNQQVHDSVSEVPFLTIVMPVRNEQRFIADTLEQLLRQDYPGDKFEIIVADGMSDDATRQIVTNIHKDHPQVRMHDNPVRRSSAGRNIGFEKGRGDIFLVIDGHCYIPGDQLFRNTAQLMVSNNVDCLGRPQPLDPPGLSDFQRAVALARSSRLGHGGDSLIFGEYEGYASPVSNGAAYTRQVFEKVGYLDEQFDAAEDVEFNYRVEQAGLKCYTSPKLTIRYYPRENLTALFRQMTRYGMGRRNFTKKHPQALSFNQLVPAGFVLGLISFIFLGIWSSISGLVYPDSGLGSKVLGFLSAIYGLYVVIVLIESLRIAGKKGWQDFRYLPLIFLSIHIGLGWGFLKQSIHLNPLISVLGLNTSNLR